VNRSAIPQHPTWLLHMSSPAPPPCSMITNIRKRALKPTSLSEEGGRGRRFGATGAPPASHRAVLVHHVVTERKCVRENMGFSKIQGGKFGWFFMASDRNPAGLGLPRVAAKSVAARSWIKNQSGLDKQPVAFRKMRTSCPPKCGAKEIFLSVCHPDSPPAFYQL
jgi:hypothetical protein